MNSEGKNLQFYIKTKVLFKKLYQWDVCTIIPQIIYFLENCSKICSLFVCETVGSVTGNYFHNRVIKSNNLLHDLFIS